MTFLHATISATLLFAAAQGLDGARAVELGPRGLPRGCTPEAQKCLEKLEARLLHNGSGIERALLDLHETDPLCAMLLRNAPSGSR